MSRTILLVGTRKGLFVLEGDESRRDWKARGPYCEGWPVYHAVYDPEAGTIFAAAASEWHGSAVWRSSDLGETWEHSSEGIAYEDGRRLSKVSNVSASHGRCSSASTRRGSSSRRTADRPGRSRRPWPASRGARAGRPREPAAGAPRYSAIVDDPADREHWWAIVQGIGLYETADDGKSWTPRNRGLRAEAAGAGASSSCRRRRSRSRPIPCHDRPPVLAVGRIVDDRRDTEVPRQLARGVVPALAPRLASQGRLERPGRSAVRRLEDPRRVDADEHAPVRRRHV